MPSSKIIIIAGPTASGKSGLALDLAQACDGVVINADSMQVYKDIPILAATPSFQDMEIAPHKLYGIYDASIRGNMVDWFNLTVNEINQARAQNKTPIVVGGTGMYIEALTKGITPIPETPQEIRNEISNLLREKGLDFLYQELTSKDPETAARLSSNDTTRIRRALEVLKHTQTTMSEWQKVPLKQFFASEELIPVYINPLRKDLDERGRLRFDIMMNMGALEEVQKLMTRNLSDSLPAMRALGVQELESYLKGETGKEEAIEAAKLHTRQYAKRQSTWFNNRFQADFCLKSCYNHDKYFVDDIKKAL